MKTLIISAFPGCGKTYLVRNQEELLFRVYEERKHFSFLDSDSSKFEKKDGWEKEYVDSIERVIGTVDFIFISQQEGVLKELKTRGIPFVVIAPDNAEWTEEKERALTKQQWFGRFLLKDNSHMRNFDSWLKKLVTHYDKQTTVEQLTQFDPVSFFLLKENQYLSDIMEDLYWKKETVSEYNATKEVDAQLKAKERNGDLKRINFWQKRKWKKNFSLVF